MLFGIVGADDEVEFIIELKNGFDIMAAATDEAVTEADDETGSELLKLFKLQLL